jgi:hypothetical protein
LIELTKDIRQSILAGQFNSFVKDYQEESEEEEPDKREIPGPYY